MQIRPQPRPLLSTIAVTGATGVIGRRLVPALLAAGAAVRVLTRQPGPPPAASIQSVPGDLRDPSSLATLVAGADAVVHLAGLAHTALRTPPQEAAAAAINVGGTRSLLQAAVAAGTRHVVFLSSAHVYAGQQGTNLRENSRKEAGHGYAAMKLQAEALLHNEATSALTVDILRPCLVYGPGVRFNLQQLLRAVQAGRYVHPGGADVLRSLVSVDTVTAAVLHFLRCRTNSDNTSPAGHSSPAVRICNVADRDAVSLRAWVDTLARSLQVRPPRTVPVSVLRTAATLGSIVCSAGIPFPLTTASLRKLTVPFTLNLDSLADTGFVWPNTTEQVAAQMVAHFLAEVRAPARHEHHA